VRDPVVGSLVAAGSDLLGGLGLDELLERPLGELTDKIGAVSDAERVEQLGQGRSDRAIGVISSLCTWRTHRASRRWLTWWWTGPEFPPRQGTHTSQKPRPVTPIGDGATRRRDILGGIIHEYDVAS
jgi:hypothetical protein